MKNNLVVYYHKDKGAWKESHTDESFEKVVADNITIFKNPLVSHLAENTPPEFWIWDGKKFDAMPRRKQKYRLQANSVRYTAPPPVVKKSYKTLFFTVVGAIILGVALSCVNIHIELKPEAQEVLNSIYNMVGSNE